MAEGRQMVIADVPCVSCGYNVRMLMADGVCPECRAPVATTLQETAIRWGARYLRGLASSTITTCGGALAIVFILAATLGGIYLMRTTGIAEGEAFRFIPFLFFCAIESCVVFHVVGVFGLTRPPGVSQRSAKDRWLCAGALLFTGTLAWPLLVTFILASDVVRGIGRDGERLLEYLSLSIPMGLFGLPIYAILMGDRLAHVYHCAGLRGQEGFGRWSLRTLAAGALVLGGLLAFLIMLGLSDVRRWEWRRFLDIVVPLLSLGGLALWGLGLLGSLIALFQFAKRMRGLAGTIDETTWPKLVEPVPAGANDLTNSSQVSPVETSPPPPPEET